MADSYIQLPADSTGKKMDTEQLTVSAQTVQRERMQVAGAAAAAIAGVTNAAPAATDYGIVAQSVNHLYNGSTLDRQRGAQGDSAAAAGIASASPVTFNEFNYDRVRGNVELTFLSSGARTTTQTQSDQTNYNSKGIKVVLDVTTAGTGSITLSIQGKDSASGKYFTILAGAAVTTVSTNIYTVYPGMLAAANSKADDIIPRVYRLLVTHNNANSITYSVGWNLIL